MTVRDKVVIITGSSRGHGRSIAVAFAKEGAKLALVDIGPLSQTEGDCKEYGSQVITFNTDLREPAAVKSMIDQVHQHYGRIDVLVNDAGIVTHFRYAGVQRWPRIADMDPEFFDKVIRTNLFGTFLTTKYTIPYMEAQGGGHIINFGQGNVGSGPRPDSIGTAPYHTSKLAIRAFSMDVAAEEADKNVCVISFGPGGPGGSERRDAMTPEEVSAEAAKIDLGLGMAVVSAADIPMSMAGRMFVAKNGKAVPSPDEVL